MITKRLLLGSALFLTAPLAFGFVAFEGSCDKGKDYEFVSEDGYLEVKARCGGSWTLDGYADASSSYIDGEVNARSPDGFKCKGSYYGPWEKFRGFSTECDGGSPDAKVHIEIKTHHD